MKLIKILPMFILYSAFAKSDYDYSYRSYCRVKEEKLKCKDYRYEFYKGFLAGASVAVSVDFLRDHVLPNLDKFNLYGNYGICRDRLEGQCKTALSLFIAGLYDYYCNNKKVLLLNKLAARTLGVVVGINFAAWSKKHCSI